MQPTSDKDIDEVFHKITEDQIYKFVTKSIARYFYDVIETHENAGSEFIPVSWLRQYTDKICETFPAIKPSMLRKDLKDTDFAE